MGRKYIFQDAENKIHYEVSRLCRFLINKWLTRSALFRFIVINKYSNGSNTIQKYRNFPELPNLTAKNKKSSFF